MRHESKCPDFSYVNRKASPPSETDCAKAHDLYRATPRSTGDAWYACVAFLRQRTGHQDGGGAGSRWLKRGETQASRRTRILETVTTITVNTKHAAGFAKLAPMVSAVMFGPSNLDRGQHERLSRAASCNSAGTCHGQHDQTALGVRGFPQARESHRATPATNLALR